MVWASYQLERWRRRLHKLHPDENDPDANRELQRLRNALEHLDEAVISKDKAISDKGSLADIGGLEIEVGGALLFGRISTEDLKKDAWDRVAAAQDELEKKAGERYLALAVDEEIEKQRGL